MTYSTMASPTFDESTFISTILRICREDYSLNTTTIFTENFINEIGFNTEKEKSILQTLRNNSGPDAHIYDESLYSYLLNKFEYELDDCYDSEEDTDEEN
jgi:hypothetical protein